MADIPTIPTPVAEPKKEGQLSPEREALEVKMKQVEIDVKLHELAANTEMDKLGIERMVLENEEIKKRGCGWTSPLEHLLAVSKAWSIDNERTVIGSDPALKSIWEEHEMEEIKYLIMKKARKL